MQLREIGDKNRVCGADPLVCASATDALRSKNQLLATDEKPARGPSPVGTPGRGRPPHNLCRCSVTGKTSGIGLVTRQLCKQPVRIYTLANFSRRLSPWCSGMVHDGRGNAGSR
jgi:hypothetical protein